MTAIFEISNTKSAAHAADTAFPVSLLCITDDCLHNFMQHTPPKKGGSTRDHTHKPEKRVPKTGMYFMTKAHICPMLCHSDVESQNW